MILPGPLLGSTCDAEARSATLFAFSGSRRSASRHRVRRVSSRAASAAACRSDTRANGARSEIVSPSNSTSSRPTADLATKRHHLLGHLHQILIVAVRLIELEHRELRVVPRRDAFVAEIAVDLVNALEAADDQPLQIQLGGDPQIQIDVERVVMRPERTRHRAARNRLHHRRLDLEVAARIEELAQRREHLAAHLEHLARLGIHDQIQIALAVANLDVRQPVPLLGQRHVALREELEARRPDRQLVRARAEQMAFDADDSRRSRAAGTARNRARTASLS